MAFMCAFPLANKTVQTALIRHRKSWLLHISSPKQTHAIRTWWFGRICK